MGILRTGVGKTGWAIVLAAAAGMVLVAGDACADRSRSRSSSAPAARHHHHHSHSHRHFSAPRIVVAPVIVPRRYYYVPAPIYYAPPVYVPPVAYAPPVYPSLNSPYAFFCPDYRAYYPQVMDCPSGWVQVAPGGAPPY